ncbi:MAG: Hsp20/alpha crystallin family protein [Ignavibacteriales bacterium]|nr:Hsp20/alpha crystallin family protein [Ignavibacteriales bacterium]MCF8306574.1 Hsp20/alpha crystallin family protein [Ignavibacteriales bacterium]MCF8316373.1 Hsp20/alpha crystallin family protein [Ignavibacteriales bacterium]MCF8437669.1 Hsp20/alpha crystallin family protein [Ignavibacteriales bacterium]
MLTRYNPFFSTKPISRNFEKSLFDDFEFENSVYPKVNIYEKDFTLIIDFETPGFKKEELKITLEDGIISVEGKKEAASEENIKILRREISSTSFKRSFTLPEEFSFENVTAEYENGILKLKLDKKEKDYPIERTIEIK